MRPRSLLRKPIFRGAMVGVACALCCWLLNGTLLVRGLENWALDTCLVFRGDRASHAKVIIVALDEESWERMGKPEVFISPELAKVVTFLHRRGAAAVGIDYLIPESTETPEDLQHGGRGDAETMGIAVGRCGNVVLPEWIIHGDKTRRPIFEWQPWQPLPAPSWASLGYINMTVDADSVIRRQHLRARDEQGQARPCFALAVLGTAEHLPEEWFLAPQLKLDGRSVPVDADGQLLINYVGPAGTIRSVPFGHVLQAAEGKRSLDCDFAGAMVLLGATNRAQTDLQATPYANQSIPQVLRSSWFGRKAGWMPGVEVHANLLATLADRAFITTPWWMSTPLTLLLVGAALGAAMARMSLEAGALLALAHHGAWRALSLAAFWYAHWRLEAVSMLVLGVLVYGVTFALRWRWIRRMMGMVKSEAVARALENDPAKLDLRGDELEVSVLFSDIRGFTSFSEHRTPQEVVRLLNAYFTAVVPTIEAHGGTVNQYLGDGLMVIFGAPVPQPDHAARAVRAARDVVRRVHQLQDQWKQLGAENFRIGVGVHSGKAVVGTVGSPRRLDYTAIGDTVNTASRIESGNKELGTEILVSQATLAALPEEERRRLSAVGPPQTLAVKGKQETLTVYPLMV